MKTRHLVTFSFVSLLCCVNSFRAAQAQALPPTGTPKIEFATPVFDFGKVSSGEVVRHDFVFTNTGSATLQILDVKPGCGCTAAGTWDKTVEPGKTGSIPPQLNSTGFGGRITKSATIFCNDPARTNVILQITGTVWKPIDVTPTMAVFSLTSDAPTNQTRTVKIVSNLDQPVTITPLESTNRAFSSELRTIRDGKEFELVITAHAALISGATSVPLKFKTSAKEQPELNITAYASVVPPISIIPAQVMLPAGPVSSNSHPSVTIRNNSATNLVLSEPSINVPGATVALKELQAGRVFNLALNLPAGFQSTPGQKLQVTVKSNHPKNPVITVPVYQSAAVARTTPLATPVPPRIAVPQPAPAK